jgi:galactokinase
MSEPPTTTVQDDSSERTARLLEEFRTRFTGDPVVVRAPGRVNLIGEHTDYNDGFVLPIAISRDVRIAVAPREDDRVRLYSLNFQETAEFSLGQIAFDPNAGWSNYVRGMADQLIRSGARLRGMEGVVEGNVPIASGLSSSAAMEIAAGLAFQVTSGARVEPVEMARLAQRAENEFMGVHVGIMDQFISRLGEAGQALFIDCRSLEYRAVPLHAGDHRFVVADSQQSRELAGSAYNERRGQCEAAVQALAALSPGIRALRDVDEPAFLRFGYALDTVVGRRARHVVHEDARVLTAIAALEASDLATFGALMNESHESLRFDYEVSSHALDVLVGAARQVEGCLGSRLTGAGFGGCTVSLVHKDAVAEFERQVTSLYREAVGTEPIIYVTPAADGAGILRDLQGIAAGLQG